VKISATLSGRAESEPGAEHLLRTTMAHEAAHVLLHRILFLQQSEALFGGRPSRQELCRDVRFTNRYAGEWWEWQANRGMAALLLPRSAVTAVVGEVRTAPDQGTIDAGLARVFNVSRQAAGYRLQQLQAAATPGQVAWSF
jgi:Zn-dependent peptidase ImmA (M78 family)